MIRVVLDANVVISGTICPLGTPANILRAWRAEYFEVITCPALLAEIGEKLRLPRIQNKYSISDREILELILRLGQAKHLVPGLSTVNPPPPDLKDIMLFSATIEGKADYIVTGDKILQEFDWKGPGKILSPSQFWQDEFPRHLVLELRYPVFFFEDLQATSFLTVEAIGQIAVALFTTLHLAESYRQKKHLLGELRVVSGPEELATCLKLISESQCRLVAFNPIAEDCLLQPIDTTLRELEKG